MDCQHEWDDPRPIEWDTAKSTLPPSESNIVACHKCGAPLQLERRAGMWEPTEWYDDGAVRFPTKYRYPAR